MPATKLWRSLVALQYVRKAILKVWTICGSGESSSWRPDDKLDSRCGPVQVEGQTLRGRTVILWASERLWSPRQSLDTRFLDLIRARRCRRPRKCLAGKLVDLIIARKCRRPRKCQAGRQATHARRLGSRQAGQEAGQPLQASQASRPGSGQARQQARQQAMQQASPGQEG